MKKTLVAILALGGMAMAASDLVYYDNALSVDGDTASAVFSAKIGSDAFIALNQLHHSPSTTLTLANMVASGNATVGAGEIQVLNSVQIVSRNNGQYRPVDAVATITLGGNTYTSSAAVYPEVTTRDFITFTFDQPVDITGATTLELNISGDFGYTCYNAKEGTTLSGDTPTWQSGGIDYHMPVRLNTSIIAAPVPEPATATLSLLALAGLAARRRRH